MSGTIDYARAILQARPGEEWTLDGNDLGALVWHSDTTPPTVEELAAAWDAINELAL